ncbi:MAG: hypothetical protein QOE15_305 [Acidimicrobiaceae bacterium]|nr:hypothetical protein [Acidimicrobiaceae bacterium]
MTEPAWASPTAETIDRPRPLPGRVHLACLAASDFPFRVRRHDCQNYWVTNASARVDNCVRDEVADSASKPGAISGDESMLIEVDHDVARRGDGLNAGLNAVEHLTEIDAFVG